MTSPKTVKNRDRGSGGGESGRRTKYKLISILKKVKLSGHFYHWNFGSSGHMIIRSALQSVVVPLSGSIPSPWTLKKCCFSPWTPGGIYHLSLFLWVLPNPIPLSILYCTMTKGTTGLLLDKYAFGGTTFNYAIFVPEPIQSLLLWPPGHYK